MLTPKERDNLADLQEQMGEIETVLRRFNRRVEILLKQLECTAAVLGEERFEQPEVARLMTLNRRLAELEQHLRDQASVLEPRLRAKLADPTNRMYDYEIDAEIAYVLREDDEEAVEHDDNILTRREERLAWPRHAFSPTEWITASQGVPMWLNWTVNPTAGSSTTFTIIATDPLSRASRWRLPAHRQDLGGCGDAPAVLLRPPD